MKMNQAEICQGDEMKQHIIQTNITVTIYYNYIFKISKLYVHGSSHAQYIKILKLHVHTVHVKLHAHVVIRIQYCLCSTRQTFESLRFIE